MSIKLDAAEQAIDVAYRCAQQSAPRLVRYVCCGGRCRGYVMIAEEGRLEIAIDYMPSVTEPIEQYVYVPVYCTLQHRDVLCVPRWMIEMSVSEASDMLAPRATMLEFGLL